MDILEIKNVTYNYSNSNEKVLSSVNQKFEIGKFYAIIGKSGAGKSTLLSLLAGLDKPKKGQILFKGNDIEKDGYSNHRKNNISLVFQNYNLIDSLRIKDNILFSLRLNKINKEEQIEKLNKLSKQLGIEEILDKYPSQCSGGQQQRAAIARALIMEPKIIFADEPTGSLDSINAKELMVLFREINKMNNTTIVMVTHDSLVASYSSKLYYLEDGKISKCIEKENKKQVQQNIKKEFKR